MNYPFLKPVLTCIAILLVSCNSSAQEVNFKDIQPGGLAELLSGKEVVIIDVRTPPEWERGKVESALTINLNHREFLSAVDELDREPSYLIYCNSGNRSRVASYHMTRMGFENIYNYNGTHFQIRREYEQIRQAEYGSTQH